MKLNISFTKQVANSTNASDSTQTPPTSETADGPTTTNTSKKKRKLQDIEEKVTRHYNVAYAEFNEAGTLLHQERLRSVELIAHIATLVSSIASTPKQFDTTISEVSEARVEFNNGEQFALKQLKAARTAAIQIGTGAGAGVATAALAPSAAMWVATTFGTASTGTAISTLSGAAATNAALAWLGGGALAAGGSGMAGGSALLALAGPVGWSIAGIAVLSSVGLYSCKQLRTKKKRNQAIDEIQQNTQRITATKHLIEDLTQRTTRTLAATNDAYTRCLPAYGREYGTLDTDLQDLLGSLVNLTQSLAILLKQDIHASESHEAPTGDESYTEDEA